MRFVTLQDLTPEMAPRREWVQRNLFSGILIPEALGRDEFMNFVCRLMPPGDLMFEIAHAEFRQELSFVVRHDAESAFHSIFDVGYEDVFVRVAANDIEVVFWIPAEHLFHAIFGKKDHLRRSFSEGVEHMREEMIVYSEEEYFNRRTRSYISRSMSAYFDA